MTAKKRVAAPSRKKKPETTALPPTPVGIAKEEQALACIGAQLRSIVTYLRHAETYVIVAHTALEGQGVEQDREIAFLLKHPVGDLLFRQIRDLATLASACDGLPTEPNYSDDDYEDDDYEDDDEGASRAPAVKSPRRSGACYAPPAAELACPRNSSPS